MSKSDRRAVVFFYISAALLIFFYGLPVVIKFVSFLTEINQSSLPVETNDTTPPTLPRFNSLPLVTKDDNIEIKGNTEAGAKITIYINENQEEIISDSSGNFSLNFNLTKGDNYVSAKATDAFGNESQKSETQKIIYDTDAPVLEITKPQDKSEFFGSRQRQLIIEGKTEEESKVQINQRWVVVESNGNFTFTTSLQEGDNIFKVVSEDLAGNKTEKSFSVNFTL